MTRILCISFSPIETDARVLRQLRVLAEFGEVTTLGYGGTPAGATHHLAVASDAKSLPETPGGVARLALRRHRAVELTAPAERAALGLLEGVEPFDIVVANDARALPLAFAVAGDARIWVDLHEWAPQENTTSLPWRVLVAPYMDALCRRYLARTDAITTVNASIAKLYVEHYGVSPGVVRNAIPRQDLSPSPVADDAIRLVHSGVAVPERNIEALIATVEALDTRFTLDLYLMGDDDGYLGRLKTVAARVPRVTVHPPVAPAELPSTLNAYDLGVYLLPIRSLNHQLMLPNKFFDFVQARLGLLISPATETSALIAEHDLGPRLADHSVDGLVAALGSLSADDVRRYKANADAAAGALSSDTDIETMRGILRSLV